MLQNKSHLFGRCSGVNTVADQTHALCAHIRVKPLRPVLRQNADHVAALQAHGRQCQANSTCVGQVVRPADGLPQPTALVPQCRLCGPHAAPHQKYFLWCVASHEAHIGQLSHVVIAMFFSDSSVWRYHSGQVFGSGQDRHHARRFFAPKLRKYLLRPPGPAP